MAVLAALAAAGWALWWAERARRLAAERTALYGTPERPRATVQEPPDAELRVMQRVSEDTRASLAEGLVQMSREQGHGMSEPRALEEAERMLREADAWGGSG